MKKKGLPLPLPILLRVANSSAYLSIPTYIYYMSNCRGREEERWG